MNDTLYLVEVVWRDPSRREPRLQRHHVYACDGQTAWAEVTPQYDGRKILDAYISRTFTAAGNMY
jgi:hypothetical protein